MLVTLPASQPPPKELEEILKPKKLSAHHKASNRREGIHRAIMNGEHEKHELLARQWWRMLLILVIRKQKQTDL